MIYLVDKRRTQGTKSLERPPSQGLRILYSVARRLYPAEPSYEVTCVEQDPDMLLSFSSEDTVSSVKVVSFGEN